MEPFAIVVENVAGSEARTLLFVAIVKELVIRFCGMPIADALSESLFEKCCPLTGEG